MLKETDNKTQKNEAAEDILRSERKKTKSKVNIIFCQPEMTERRISVSDIPLL